MAAKKKTRIFVTVGTGRFDELIKAVDNLAKSKKSLDITAQTGDIDFVPQNIKHIKFTKQMNRYYNKADLIVCHGGAGTVYELLAMKKKIIAVANMDRTDDHQEEILRALSKERYLLWCRNLDILDDYIQKAKSKANSKIKGRNFKFYQYQKPTCKIAETIVRFLG